MVAGTGVIGSGQRDDGIHPALRLQPGHEGENRYGQKKDRTVLQGHHEPVWSDLKRLKVSPGREPRPEPGRATPILTVGFAEAGLNIESYAWYGMFVPAKTPKAVVDKINAESQKVMKGADFQRVLADTGTEYVGDSPENFGKFVQAEAAKWSKIVKDSGATVD